MSFEWDQDKADSNVRKHGVNFADAVGAFDDPRALTRADPDPGEDRFVTLGRGFLDRVLVVAWTWRGERIRIISARAATANERRLYTRSSNA